jgi:predicted RNase H-like HicB family nuclease
MNLMKFNIVLEEDLEDGGYIVHCPALKGCWSQGDTQEEALQNIKEAIAGYLKTLNDRAMLEVKIQSKAQIREVAVA